MAKHYKQSCFEVPLSPEQSYWAMTLLLKCLTRLINTGASDTGHHDSERMEEDDKKDYVAQLISGRIGSQFNLETLYEDGYLIAWENKAFDEAFVADWLQTILRHFNLPDTWGFSWVYTASHPVIGAYGGGACTVSQTSIQFLDTQEWLDERLKRNDGPVIKAEIFSSDRVLSAKFDAEPYFVQAPDYDLRLLSDSRWCDYQAERAARYVARLDGYESVQNILNYTNRLSDVSIECCIAETDARTWLAKHRPNIVL